MPWARRIWRANSRATSCFWSRPRSIRSSCTAAARRSRPCSSKSACSRNTPPGLRITDAKTLEIVEMVLAGSINKQMVGYINEAGGKAIGLVRQGRQYGDRAQADAHRDRSGFRDRESGRSRLCRRAGEGRHHRARSDSRPRAHSGAGAGRRRGERRHVQCQCRHFCRRHRRRAEGQALSAAHRRARRARQVEERSSRNCRSTTRAASSPTAPFPAA